MGATRKDKTDRTLGRAVGDHLLKLGLETPIYHPVSFGEREKLGIAHHVEEIMKLLGLDIRDPSLSGTPRRIGDMYIDELFMGLDYHNFPACTTIPNTMSSSDDFVLEKGITVNSTCEHHLITIDGFANVAYIPGEKVLGLSKMNRIVDFFARRPQVQERLTRQVAEALAFITESKDVAVFIDAVHYCVKSRGVTDAGSRTCTFHGTGRFADIHDPVRAEFMGRSR
jgi:GTP cyclohydrolase I